jgi:DNA polymerase-3 subunit alpha
MKSQISNLKSLVYQGAKQKNLDLTNKYLDRLNFELEVIERKKLVEYFILYSKIVTVCNEIGLLRSFGRSTAPSSLVNYCLDITKLDPIRENLIFERFLHPDLTNFPDIDIDIPKGFRNEFLKNFKERHPEYNVYFIAFSNKNDLNGENVPFENKVFKKHSTGIIIQKEKILTNTFSFKGDNYYYAQDLHKDINCKFKVDIVEQEYLGYLQAIVDKVGIKQHPYNLPIDDKKTFEFFRNGNLKNIFLFDSHDIAELLKLIQPNSIGDLSVISTLDRINKDDYPLIFKGIESSKNENSIFKLFNETFGVLLYEETFLNIMNQIAGMTFAEAEKWRIKLFRNINSFEEFEIEFYNRSLTHSTFEKFELFNLTANLVENIKWTLPKSHVLSYAHISYWGAYYKTHFPEVFESVFEKNG